MIDDVFFYSEYKLHEDKKYPSAPAFSLDGHFRKGRIDMMNKRWPRINKLLLEQYNVEKVGSTFIPFILYAVLYISIFELISSLVLTALLAWPKNVTGS